jgi:hypothetical protein
VILTYVRFARSSFSARQIEPKLLARAASSGGELSRDNLDENGGGNQSLKRRPVAEL